MDKKALMVFIFLLLFVGGFVFLVQKSPKKITRAPLPIVPSPTSLPRVNPTLTQLNQKQIDNELRGIQEDLQKAAQEDIYDWDF